MEKIASFDEQGRVYIPEEMRRFLKSKTLALRLIENGLLIEPIEGDPIKALGDLGKDKLRGKSVKKLKEDAQAEIEKNVLKKIC